MALKYTKMPTDAFEKLQINAGILVDDFDPTTGTIGNILGATSGGINFNSNPTYNDYGEDVDNCPANTKQMKRIASYDPAVSGTFLTCTPAVIAGMVGAADVDANNSIHVVPRDQLLDDDFTDVWFVGDYSDINTGADAGFLAIHLKNALNTTGFQIQTTKDAKGTMTFEYHAHYDIENQDDIPFEIYCKEGASGSDVPSVKLSTNYIELADGNEVTVGVTVRNSDQTAVLTSANTAVTSVSGMTITAEGSGSTIVTASITDGGVTYNDTMTVVVTA